MSHSSTRRRATTRRRRWRRSGRVAARAQARAQRAAQVDLRRRGRCAGAGACAAAGWPGQAAPSAHTAPPARPGPASQSAWCAGPPRRWRASAPGHRHSAGRLDRTRLADSAGSPVASAPGRSAGRASGAGRGRAGGGRIGRSASRSSGVTPNTVGKDAVKCPHLPRVRHEDRPGGAVQPPARHRAPRARAPARRTADCDTVTGTPPSCRRAPKRAHSRRQVEPERLQAEVTSQPGAPARPRG